MVVRGGGDGAGHPGAGLQEGGQVGSVQAGRQHATAVEGVGPGGWVKGPEGVCVGIGPENAAQGLAGVSDEACVQSRGSCIQLKSPTRTGGWGSPGEAGVC